MRQLRNPEGADHHYKASDVQSAEYRAFKAKLLSFSTRISEHLARREFSSANLAFSPLSVEMCLGLAIRSSAGETRSEMLDALGVDFDTLNRYYKTFFDETLLHFENYYKQLEAAVEITNSIWIDDEVTPREDTLDALASDYYCYSFEADFNNSNKESNEAISQFIEEKSHGLLKVNPRIAPDVLFVLMNTLYLKDIWNGDGEELSLAPEEYVFTNLGGGKSSKQLVQGRYFEGKAMEKELFSAFHTYTKNGFGLHFIKPNAGVSVNQIMTQAILDEVIAGPYTLRDNEKKEEYYTKCIFPTFDANCDIDLIRLCQEDLGITALFRDGVCDFSELSNTNVYCNQFRHVGRLEVTRRGIEGAAVTYMAEAGATGPDQTWTKVYETFPVDGPFGFVLTRNGAVLFSGIVADIG